MAIDFSNTAVAFQNKDKASLKKAYWLFKIVSKPAVVNFGKWAMDIAIKIHFPINWFVKKTIFSQFCGGENIEECDAKIKELDKNNVGTILDYSCEGKELDSELDATAKEVMDTIDRAKTEAAIPFCVFKPTGIAQFNILEKSNESIDGLNESERQAYGKVVERMNKICKKAHDLSVPIFVDAEDSWIQDAIDRLCEVMIWKYNKETSIVYTTVQMYRWDRLDYLKSLCERARRDGMKIGVKLVRGAYMEKERERAKEMGYKDPIQATKAATDKDYDAALRFCVENLDVFSICAGSHNEDSANVLVDLIEEKGLDKNDPRLYFAQLLGMSDHISFNLSASGYNVAKYVPYGPVKEVMPYLIRRAQENTSVAGQTGRELSLIQKEIKRRKSLK